MTEQTPNRILSLPPIGSSGHLNVVVETPRGSRIKYIYDGETGLFKLHKMMPTGTVFPFDFGFLPSTRGADGDPLDVLVLMEEPVVVGSLVEVRLIGVIEAQQTQKGKTTRNDRLVGVAWASHLYHRVRFLRDLGSNVLGEIETFFVFYNELQGRKFKPLGRHNASHAMSSVRGGKAEFEKHRETPGRTS